MRFRAKKQEFPISGWGMAGIAAGAGLVTLAALRRARRVNFAGHVAVITGGSRGLGLQMARQLAEEGARLAILARNEPDLEIARQELRSFGADVLAVPCDVSDRSQVERAVAQVMDQYGRVDLLINNAGIIQVGPVDHMRLEDFETAMNVHYWGPLYAMLSVIPIMRRQGGGRIVNIASIGGQVAVPHLAPYDSSKFALVGLSDAMRAELSRDNIAVSTICPGLMRTGSYYQGNFKGNTQKEFAWFALMASNPLVAMSSRRAARQILNSARYGVPKRTLTFQARAISLLERWAPNLSAWVWKQFNNALPRPIGDQGNELRTGFESRSKAVPSWATKLGDRAADRNNEMLAERIP